VFDVNNGFNEIKGRIPLPEFITNESAKFAELAHSLKNCTKRFPIATHIKNGVLVVAVPHMDKPNVATITFFSDLARTLPQEMPKNYEVNELSEDGV
jgi:hypothetical protein